MKLPTTEEVRVLQSMGHHDPRLTQLLRKWETCYLELVALPSFTPDVIRRCYAAEERSAKRALVLAGCFSEGQAVVTPKAHLPR